jgi:MFS family permease
VFVGAIALFALASLGCAVSTSLGELLAMRVLQGAGGAMMLPVGRLVVLARTAKADLMRITAYIVWPALLAPVVAPVAGGAITTYANWHWLFLVNLPLAAIAITAALRLIGPSPHVASVPLDRRGVALTCVGLGGAAWVAGLLSGSHPRWVLVVIAALASAAVLALAARHLLHARHPLVNLRTLRTPTFGGAVGGLAIFGIAIGATPFLLALLFQDAFGWSAVKSGSVVLFVFAGNIAIKPATTFLYRRAGFRAMLVVATAGMGGTLVAAAFVRASTPIPLIAAILFASGVTRSIGGTGYSTVAFADVPADELPDANTLQAAAQQLSVGFGAAAATIALRAGGPLAHTVLGSSGVTAPYSVAFCLIALVALLATLGALRLHPTAGNVLRGGAGRAAPRPAVEP